MARGAEEESLHASGRSAKCDGAEPREIYTFA